MIIMLDLFGGRLLGGAQASFYYGQEKATKQIS